MELEMPKTIVEPPCFFCKWLIKYPVCIAFLEGIPDDIRLNGNQHTEPYPGDNGFRFEPYKKDETNEKQLVEKVVDLVKGKLIAAKGGVGSGNFGHDGRPGKVGGSAPSKGLPEPINEIAIGNESVRYGRRGG